jgi:hypothetical protein
VSRIVMIAPSTTTSAILRSIVRTRECRCTSDAVGLSHAEWGTVGVEEHRVRWRTHPVPDRLSWP